jgi:hypothetical protein
MTAIIMDLVIVVTNKMKTKSWPRIKSGREKSISRNLLIMMKRRVNLK